MCHVHALDVHSVVDHHGGVVLHGHSHMLSINGVDVVEVLNSIELSAVIHRHLCVMSGVHHWRLLVGYRPRCRYRYRASYSQ